MCFTENPATGTRAALTTVNPGALTATLTAPNGQTISQALKTQFGWPGCFTFDKPLVLTQPGQYLLDLTGAINGTTMNAQAITAGGAVLDRSSITFPEAGVPTNADLRDDINRLSAELAILQAEVDAQHDDAKGIPTSAPALLLGLLAVAVALRRNGGA